MKTIIVAGLLLGCAHAPGVQAGETYVQTELNSAVGGAASTEIHVGRQGGNGFASWYLQGGPLITSDSGANTTDLSGKIGGSITDIVHGLDVYGEVSAVFAEDADYATKVGVKYHFH